MRPFLSQVLDTLISVTQHGEGILMGVTDSRPIVLKDLDQSLVSSCTDSLISLAKDISLTCNPEDLRLCVKHLLYVEQINEYINLTRIVDLNDAIVLHILDSLTLLPYVPSSATYMLDMGTGPGFPGIPLAVTCALKADLLDSVGKKIKAVNAIVDTLNIDGVHGVHVRLEDHARMHRNAYDLVVARALAPLNVLLEYASPLTAKEGHLILSKGNLDDDELSQGVNAAKQCGFSLIEHNTFELPCGFGHREILKFKKSHQAAIQLPRATGLARKNPLA